MARHRLAVGDDGEGLEGGLGQAGLLPVEDESLDHGRVLVAAVHPPPSPDLAQREPTLLGRVPVLQLAQGGLDVSGRLLDRRRQRHDRHGLVDDHEHRLEGSVDPAGEVGHVEGQLVLGRGRDGIRALVLVSHRCSPLVLWW